MLGGYETTSFLSAPSSPACIEWPAKVRFTCIDLVLKADRMAKLINGVDLTADAPVDHFAHASQVAIEKVVSPC
jgi:hypothetical protein